MPTPAASSFTANELWTLWIAAYAAVVSTFVLGWDAYKWLASGARLNLSASMNMKVLGGMLNDEKDYISVTAMNVGDRPTTITNLGILYFESGWRTRLLRRKADKAFIITSPSETQPIPYRFDVGAQWIGLAEQNDDIVQMARDGYLYFVLYTATNGHGQRVRLKYRAKVTAD